MTANNIKVNKNEEIGTIVYIAVNNQFKGSIVISDKIKSDSEKAIKEIKRSRYKRNCYANWR